MAPPVPIPNTEVKRPSADDTAPVTEWENRSLPESFRLDSCGAVHVLPYLSENQREPTTGIEVEGELTVRNDTELGVTGSMEHGDGLGVMNNETATGAMVPPKTPIPNPKRRLCRYISTL